MYLSNQIIIISTIIIIIIKVINNSYINFTLFKLIEVYCMVDFFKHADKILIYWCVNENYFVEISKIQFGEMLEN